MDIGFTRRAQPRPISPLDQLNYARLLAELAAAQAESATARAQSRIGTEAQQQKTAETSSFHAPTADLLRNAKDS